MRGLLPTVRSVEDVARVIALIPENAPFPASALRIPRGKSGGEQVVALPEGYLDDLADDTPPVAAAGVVADGG